MEKIHRSGVDLQVAFRSAMKRASADSELSDASGNAAASENGEAAAAHAVPTIISLRAGIKAFFRKAAQSGYRLFKPMLKPLAVRTRSYLTEELNYDLRREIQKISTATVQELQSALHQEATQSVQALEDLRSVIREEIQSAVAAQERRSIAALQELRLALRHEVQAAAAAQERRSAAAVQELWPALRREVQAGTAAQELQTAAALQELQSVIRHELLDEALLPRMDRIEQYSSAAARRIAVSCGSGEMLVKTAAGFVVCPAADYALLACLVDTGDLELGTRLLIQKFLKPGDTYVDVGANVGMHVLAAARAMEGRGEIIGFEPFEPTQRMLEKTVWMNGFSDCVEIRREAVSDRTGRQALFLGLTSGHHSLFQLNTPDSLVQPPVEVPVVRLDDAIGPDRKVDLLKIDVEGAELEVLAGGASVIAANPDIALIAEFGSAHLCRVGRTPEQWMEAFGRFGLDYRVIDAYSGELEEWSLDRLLQVESANLFLARGGSRAWSRLSA
jgi:FkbM family methyltransferase